MTQMNKYCRKKYVFSLKIALFWGVTPRSVVDPYQNFEKVLPPSSLKTNILILIVTIKGTPNVP
jgi:hypothetical protein